MIAYLIGMVREVREHSAIVLTQGLGYEVFCPASTLGKLRPEQQAEFHTRFVVREDAQMLFGFGDADSVKVFDLLVSVSGVGPKLALALLSSLPLDALCTALSNGDVKLLSSVSGVGKKTAERLVLELGSKVPANLTQASTVPAQAVLDQSAAQDAIAALLALGFREPQVRSVIAALLANDASQSADTLIRKGLGQLR